MFRLMVAVAVAAATGGLVDAQLEGCPPATSPGGEEWIQYEGQWFLYRGGRQVAAFDPSTNVYRDYNPDSGEWGPKRTPPWVENFGVDTSKLCREHGECYRVNGRKVGRDEFQAAIEGKLVPDDAKQLRLTLIGSATAREAALSALRSGELAGLTDGVIVNSYSPDNPLVAKCGFVTSGHPTVYLQRPDGKVLLRLDKMDSAVVAAALRRARQDYDPAKDPNGSVADWFAKLRGVPLELWAVGALVVLLVFQKREGA